MLDLCKLIFGTVIDLLRSRATLEAEIVVLRQQVNVLQRANPKRLRLGSIDRLILGGVCRLFPKVYESVQIWHPEAASSDSLSTARRIRFTVGTPRQRGFGSPSIRLQQCGACALQPHWFHRMATGESDANQISWIGVLLVFLPGKE
jgi:hypothetical protein